MSEHSIHHVNGIVLSVRTWPSPNEPSHHPDIVLLHGTGLTSRDWDVVAADLSRDRTVHAVDLRGHGQSDRPGTYSIDLMAADITALLETLDSTVDVVGHSLGGLVAIMAAADGRVRRLVLEDVGLPRERPPAPPQRPGNVDHLPFDWAVVEQVRPEIDHPAEHWPGTIARLDLPVLAVAGGPTSFVPHDWIADLVATAPDATTVTIPVGHEIHVGEPTAYIRAVRDHLDR